MRTSVFVDEQTGRLHGVHFQIRPGSTARTREVVDGKAMAQYDAAGQLLGVSVKAPCTIEQLDRIAADEPEAVRQFLRRAVPVAMVA